MTVVARFGMLRIAAAAQPIPDGVDLATFPSEAPQGTHTVVLGPGEVVTDVNFGNRQVDGTGLAILAGARASARCRPPAAGTVYPQGVLAIPQCKCLRQYALWERENVVHKTRGLIMTAAV
jgi:hypothetical protein